MFPSPSTIVSHNFGTRVGVETVESDDDDAVVASAMTISHNSITGPTHIISDGPPFIDPTNVPASNIQKTSQRRQIIAALSANLGSMALGACLSWTATALPDLRVRESSWDISPLQESWIGSSMTPGAILGCFVAGFSMEFGRRFTMLILIVPFLLGWLSIFFAQNVVMIYIGRILTGLSCGILTLVVPIYIVETSDDDIRGALTSAFDVFITIGILYIYLLGSYTTWRIQALFCGLIPVTFFISMLLMPESPRYLVEKNRQVEAVKAILWLRNTQDSQQVQAELVEIKRDLDESKGQNGSWRDLLTLPVMKPMTICLALMFFQQLSGIEPIVFYTVDIFQSAGVNIDENLSTNIIGVAQVGATVVAALVVDRCGRRLLLLLSGVTMTLSLGALGLFFYLKEMNHKVAPENLGWLPLSSILIYVIAFSIGYGPLPWLLMGELIPAHLIGIGAGLVTAVCWSLVFAVTISFEPLIQFLGHDGAYWFFACMSILGTLYVYFFVFETRNKTLHEIYLHFNPQSEPLLPPTS